MSPCVRPFPRVQRDAFNASGTLMAKNIKTRTDDYSQWYLDVIKAAQLADYSPVQRLHGHPPGRLCHLGSHPARSRPPLQGHRARQRLFPAADPQSFLTREAEHVEGFAMECAIVTHSKLQKGADGKLAPAGELEEPLIIRPTSETIIGHMYARVDPVLSRPAGADQPVVQRDALGDAHAAVPPHRRIPLAGRPHRPRNRRGGPGRNPADAGCLRRLSPRSSWPSR